MSQVKLNLRDSHKKYFNQIFKYRKNPKCFINDFLLYFNYLMWKTIEIFFKPLQFIYLDLQ